ncbi:hypothetical protein THAOC_20887 [Thalassiosira oceanica]|uniref:Uncharacterized protein n=1 Tax=Thalassiosira oceanica TaxID=159749 RepID=K0S0U6_THAOC|nr:hypothetical protein THAOC_20887 [Thalassiosira oceanica]|eukprot:EJK58950.1 hypothetical protein THAOC_20887 [Thalassiosira oceanica]
MITNTKHDGDLRSENFEREAVWERKINQAEGWADMSEGVKRCAYLEGVHGPLTLLDLGLGFSQFVRSLRFQPNKGVRRHSRRRRAASGGLGPQAASDVLGGRMSAHIAQSEERPAFNRVVVGSSPHYGWHLFARFLLKNVSK